MFWDRISLNSQGWPPAHKATSLCFLGAETKGICYHFEMIFHLKNTIFKYYVSPGIVNFSLNFKEVFIHCALWKVQENFELYTNLQVWGARWAMDLYGSNLLRFSIVTTVSNSSSGCCLLLSPVSNYSPFNLLNTEFNMETWHWQGFSVLLCYEESWVVLSVLE